MSQTTRLKKTDHITQGRCLEKSIFRVGNTSRVLSISRLSKYLEID